MAVAGAVPLVRWPHRRPRSDACAGAEAGLATWVFRRVCHCVSSRPCPDIPQRKGWPWPNAMMMGWIAGAASGRHLRHVAPPPNPIPAAVASIPAPTAPALPQRPLSRLSGRLGNCKRAGEHVGLFCRCERNDGGKAGVAATICSAKRREGGSAGRTACGGLSQLRPRLRSRRQPLTGHRARSTSFNGRRLPLIPSQTYPRPFHITDMRLTAASRASAVGGVAARRARQPARAALRAVASAAQPTPRQVEHGHGAKGAEGWRGEEAGGFRVRWAALPHHTVHPGAAAVQLLQYPRPPEVRWRQRRQFGPGAQLPCPASLLAAAAGWDLSKRQLDPHLQGRLLTYGELVQVRASLHPACQAVSWLLAAARCPRHAQTDPAHARTSFRPAACPPAARFLSPCTPPLPGRLRQLGVGPVQPSVRRHAGPACSGRHQPARLPDGRLQPDARQIWCWRRRRPGRGRRHDGAGHPGQVRRRCQGVWWRGRGGRQPALLWPLHEPCAAGLPMLHMHPSLRPLQVDCVLLPPPHC